MYWDALLKEVLAKDDSSKAIAAYRSSSQQANRKEVKKYFFSHENDRIYFTNRETEVMIMLLKGKTISLVATELNLSPRTVEFYVKNMKIKLSCRTKSELIGKVFASDFLRNLGFFDELFTPLMVSEDK